MAGTREKKRRGLDANLPFDLAAEKDSAFEFKEVFESKGYTSICLRLLLTSYGSLPRKGRASESAAWPRLP